MALHENNILANDGPVAVFYQNISSTNEPNILTEIQFLWMMWFNVPIDLEFVILKESIASHQPFPPMMMILSSFITAVYTFREPLGCSHLVSSNVEILQLHRRAARLGSLPFGNITKLWIMFKVHFKWGAIKWLSPPGHPPYRKCPQLFYVCRKEGFP